MYQDSLKTGELTIGFNASMTYVKGGHAVTKDQYEPGIPDAQQPQHHNLDVVVTSWTLSTSYGLHKRLALEFDLPFRANFVGASFDDGQGEEIAGFSSIHHRDETIAGIGDIFLGARIAAIRPTDVPRLSIDITAGTSIPTGHIEPDPFLLGEQGKEHQHMFFGRGTFIPRFGLKIDYSFDQFSLSGWVQSKTSFVENSEGYHPSSTATGGFSVASSFGLQQWRFMLQQMLFHESKATWSGRRAENSGRTDLIAALGVIYQPHPKWSINVSARVPWKSYTYGAQMRIPVILGLGARYKLNLLN